MDKKRFVLGVDLDETCADFYGGLRPIAAEWLSNAEHATSLPSFAPTEGAFAGALSA